MSMVVQHNMQAMNANRMLGITSGQQAKSTEKLSSGYKINRAADDAAGLSISEKMRAQIRGLNKASDNAQDGISLIQTAEGALNETHSILQRMRELSVQAANGTETDDDREAIQSEISQLQEEVTRISETTQFNTMNLLDGSKATAKKGVSVDGSITTGGEIAKLTSAKDTTVPFTDLSGLTSTDFATKETLNIDGADIEVDWGKLSETEQGVLKKDFTSANITSAEKKAAAELIQNTINQAIKDSGHSVADITVKVGSDGFIFESGSKGVDSKIELQRDKTSSTLAGVLDKLAGTTTVSNGITTGVDAYVTNLSAAGTATYNGESIVLDPATITPATVTSSLANATITTEAVDEWINIDGIDLQIHLDKSTNIGANLTSAATSTTAAAAAQELQDAINKAVDEYNGANGTNLRHVTVTGEDSDAATTNKKDATFTFAGATVKGAQDTINHSGNNTLDALGITNSFNNGVSAQEEMTMKLGGQEMTIGLSNIKSGDAMSDVADKLETAINDAIKKYNATKAEDDQFKEAKVEVTKDGRLSVSSESGAITFEDIGLGELAQKLGLTDVTTSGKEANGGIRLQIGANEGQTMTFGIDDMSAEALGVDGKNVDLSKQDSAEKAVTTIDAAIKKVSAQRSALGAIQNRLEHTVSNLDNISENTQSAESAIRDTDMASEMVNYSKNNILAQAGQSMLAQANQSNQGVLSLLG